MAEAFCGILILLKPSYAIEKPAKESTRVHLRMLAIAMNLSKNNFFNVGSPFILLVPGRSLAAAAEGGGTGFGFLFHRPALANLSCTYN